MSITNERRRKNGVRSNEKQFRWDRRKHRWVVVLPQMSGAWDKINQKMADTSKIATFAIIRFDNSQILFPFVVFIYVETEERS